MSDIKERLTKILWNDMGKAVSSRFTHSYFTNNNLSDLWNKVHEITHNAPEEISFRERVWFIMHDENPGTCNTCGKTTGLDMSYGWNKAIIKQYCNKDCMYADNNLSERRKVGQRKVNQSHADKKRRETLKEKYGHEYNSQRPEVSTTISQKAIERQNSPERLVFLQNKDILIDLYVNQEMPLQKIAQMIGNDDGTIISSRLRQWGIDIRSGNGSVSYEEKLLREFVESLDVTVQSNKRILEGGYEIDIYLPDYNIGIEYNGLFWHSSKNRMAEYDMKRKHVRKTKLADDMGIRLIHINSYEWLFREEIVKSLIKAKLGMSSYSIGARKCQIVELSTTEEKQFLDDNHIQGYTQSKICYGLKHNNEIYCVMSFGGSRFNKKYDWELVRFANKKNTNVIGGASKLLKHFRSEYSGSIVSYADRTISDGGLYRSLGFELSHISRPKYYWTDGTILYNRTLFMKKKLKKKVKIYNSDLSETENMYLNGYRKYWDCGQYVFTLDK